MKMIRLSILLLYSCCCCTINAFTTTNPSVVRSLLTKDGAAYYQQPSRLFRNYDEKRRIHNSSISRLSAQPIRRRKQGNMEVGIQTAQLLLNEKKHEQLKLEISKQYPLVPSSMLDTALSVVATGFKSVAPETLKEALRPGGMDKVRPILKQAIIDITLQQQVVKNFNIISEKEKIKLIAAIVDLALNQLLKDAQWVLSSPEVRLETLEEEIKLIRKTEMTNKQLILYEYRKHPIWYTSTIILSTIFLYVQIAYDGSWKNAAIATYHGCIITWKYTALTLKRTYTLLMSVSNYLMSKIQAMRA